ncbi:protein of unknown function [Pseudomonas sp. JV551A1]|uniref:YD repeat-containing protein n=1 Tax=Pseudomonas inefficax TaxID=2078786 RepID=A0AAQ1PCA2_9PSED|nr:protein of unknown function [Pseudomonas sp. JV551A1]SPO62464.1 protein of unknown function [Pseudomonas inefficax]
MPVQVTDGAGRTRRYGYDAHGNLLWEQDPLGRSTQYQYNPEGRVTRVTDALEKIKHLGWGLAFRTQPERHSLYSSLGPPS